MMRTRDALIVVFLIGGVFFTLVTYLALKGNATDAEDQGGVKIGEESGSIDVLLPEDNKRETQRESLIAKLQDMVIDDFDETVPDITDVIDDSAIGDSQDTEEIAFLPKTKIQVGVTSNVGAQGSYCWDGVCATASLNSISAPQVMVENSSTINFEIDSTSQPDQVYIFLMDQRNAELIETRELTLDERQLGSFTLSVPSGESLLVVTGVWGGEDVASVFKLVNNSIEILPPEEESNNLEIPVSSTTQPI